MAADTNARIGLLFKDQTRLWVKAYLLLIPLRALMPAVKKITTLIRNA